MVAKYCYPDVCMPFSLCVCSYAGIFQKPHVQMSPNLLYMLPSDREHGSVSFDGNAIRYVLPILQMNSCFT